MDEPIEPPNHPEEDTHRWEDEGGAVYPDEEKEAIEENREPLQEPQNNPEPSAPPHSAA